MRDTKIYFVGWSTNTRITIYLNSHLLDDLPISFNTQIGTQFLLHAKLNSFSKFKSVPTFIYRLKAISAVIYNYLSLSNQMWNSWLSRLNYAWRLFGVALCWSSSQTEFEKYADCNSQMFDEMATYHI